MMKKIAMVLLAASLVVVGAEAQTELLSYGFEDWSGDADTTPNYFSSTGYQEYWLAHEANTEVISSCGGNLPHDGNFYFHQNFFEGFDPCLGTTPSGINPHTNIGVNLAYPPDPKNNLNLRTDVSSDIMTIRFYFRTTGNWPNAVTNYMKFIRFYGGAGTSSQILHIRDDGSCFDITDHPAPDNPDPSWGDYHNIFTAPIDWNDGGWHCVVMTIERLSENNVDPNVNVSVWWDDWAMVGESHGSAETYVPDFGSYFSHITLFVNWGATYPDSDMGIDLDDLEIWDGIPNQTTPSRSNPQPTGILDASTTQTNISLTTNMQAVCRYSNVSGTNYTNMLFNFTCTNSTSHLTPVTGLENGQTYIYYIRCNSTGGYVNEDDFDITFSIGGHKADINDDGIINMPELMPFIAGWKAGDGVSKVEVGGARDIWFSGGVY